MDIHKLQHVIVGAFEGVKVQDIKIFGTTHLTKLFDRTITANGTPDRQAETLVASVYDVIKEAGDHVTAVEGEGVGEWVLIDCSGAVVHIIQPQLRLYHNLEEIWGDKPMHVKLDGTGKHNLSKVSKGYDDEEDEVREVTPAKHRVTKPKLAGGRPIKTAASTRKAPIEIILRKPATKRAPSTSKPTTKTAVETAIKHAPAKKHAA